MEAQKNLGITPRPDYEYRKGDIVRTQLINFIEGFHPTDEGILSTGKSTLPNMLWEIILHNYSFFTFASHANLTQEALADCLIGFDELRLSEIRGLVKILCPTVRSAGYLIQGHTVAYDMRKRKHRNKLAFIIARYWRAVDELKSLPDRPLPLPARPWVPSPSTFENFNIRRFILRAEINQLLDFIAEVEIQKRFAIAPRPRGRE